jgi:hypothetical protein
LKHGGTEFAGDVDTVDGLLSGVVHLTAKDIHAESAKAPEAKAGLKGAKTVYDLRFTVKGAGKHLRLLEKKHEKSKGGTSIYALVDGEDPVYEIDVYAAEKIEKTLDEMRVGKLINVADRYAITTIDVDAHGAESFTQHLAKDSGGHWKIGTMESARGKVEGILDRLSGKIITAYTGPAPSGDLLKMTFGKTKDRKVETVAEIEFWAAKGRLYARNLRSPKKETVELASDFKPSLPWKAATLTEEKKGSGK